MTVSASTRAADLATRAQRGELLDDFHQRRARTGRRIAEGKDQAQFDRILDQQRFGSRDRIQRGVGLKISSGGLSDVDNIHMKGNSSTATTTSKVASTMYDLTHVRRPFNVAP